MSIVAMKKLRLIALQSQRDEILRELMLLGCVEISAPKDEPSEELTGTLSRPETGEAYRRRQEQASITNALNLINRYSIEKKSLLSPLPEVSLETLLDEKALGECLETAKRVIASDVNVRSIAAQESRERALIEAMKPWLGMDQPLESRGTDTCEIIYGTIPFSVQLTDAENALGETEAAIVEISADKINRYVALIFRRGRQDAVNMALRSYGFAQLSVAGLCGTPKSITENAERRIAELREKKQTEEDAIIAEASNRAKLRLGADTLATVIERGEAAEKLLNTDKTFCFEGWITAPDEEQFKKTLSEYACAWELEEPDPEHPEEVPVKLNNNDLTRPYNMVTEMYSLPAYNGIDPNPFIMPFFALFFGIMFADMAYGLILLIAGILITVKAKPRGGTRNLAGLLIECGITTFLMGFITGGFFGDAVSVIGKWFGQSWSIVPHLGTVRIGSDIAIDLPLNLLEGNNPLYVLIAAVCLGAVHLAVGVGIGMYLKIKDGQWADALLNDLCWWVIMAGIGVMALRGSKTVLYVGIGMLVLGCLITGEGLGKITGIFGAVYNGATGYLGDLLSYSRLMALMLAGSVIASVFNQLGSLGNANGITVGGTILFIVVFCIGHALNFGLNIIGCFVHTLRLQYLEFFGKWYRDGGKAFKPLSVKTKYYDIIKEK